MTDSTLTDPTEPTAAGPAAAADEAVSMVRSEERLVVGRETRVVERVRLQKHVVSEDVARTVTLRVEDGDLAADGHEPSTHEELEIVLHEERLEVVVVPVERVRVRVVRVEGERTVTEVLRREEIDLSQPPRP
jgi:stress response protein YsnF